MAGAPNFRNALVRGRWTDGTAAERTTVITVTETSAFVLTETLPAVGSLVELDLSFGPISARVAARVTYVRMSLDPGTPTGFGVEFDPGDSESPALARLVSATRLRAAVSRAPADPARSSTRERARLLHIESNRLLRDIFAYAVDRYFGSRGTRPILVQASSFAEAVAIDEPLGAVIVDHDLPDATGHEAVVHLRANNAADAWIVGVGLGGAQTRNRMLAAGADVYVQKPIVVTDVLYSLELLMHAREVRDASGAA